ncbi:hypothetical protein TPHV1_40183 [Treponema phagedenis]|uniref:Uncharacterized protein n=1 Tax=Treponema phagedenis TaxID=162 RepID=A0A0B7H0B7_TREPH|nr:hypothetical protein TPHV1_40183 [Treponema phagedenis]
MACQEPSLRINSMGAFKLIGLVLTWTSKLRTGTDARGSKQQRRFKAKLFAKLLNSQGIILPSMAKLYRFYSLN